MKTQNLQIAPEAVSMGHDGRFQTKSDSKFHMGLKNENNNIAHSPKNTLFSFLQQQILM